MIRPTEDAGLEESAVYDQLTAPFKQIEQTRFAFRSLELVLFLDPQPRHASTLGGHRITGVGQLLFLDEQLLERRFPLLLRHDGGCLHFCVSLLVLVHISVSSWFLSLVVGSCRAGGS